MKIKQATFIRPRFLVQHVPPLNISDTPVQLTFTFRIQHFILTFLAIMVQKKKKKCNEKISYLYYDSILYTK